MLGAGSLPDKTNFTIQKIVIFPDDDFAIADLQDFLVDSYVEITLNDAQVFMSPLRSCVGLSSYAGHFTQAVAADEALIGLEGMGFELQEPIVVEGGVSFLVELGQGKALSAANMGVKVALYGILNTG